MGPWPLRPQHCGPSAVRYAPASGGNERNARAASPRKKAALPCWAADLLGAGRTPGGLSPRRRAHPLRAEEPVVEKVVQAAHAHARAREHTPIRRAAEHTSARGDTRVLLLCDWAHECECLHGDTHMVCCAGVWERVCVSACVRACVHECLRLCVFVELLQRREGEKEGGCVLFIK